MVKEGICIKNDHVCNIIRWKRTIINHDIVTWSSCVQCSLVWMWFDYKQNEK